MSQNDKRKSRVSYAAGDQKLALQMPAALRKQQPVSQPFNDAVNPLRAKDRAAQKLTEKQRRDEAQRASKMVKKEKPLMELKPTFANDQKRRSFNQDWIKERHQAAMQYLKKQEAELSCNKEQPDHNYFPKML